MKNNQTEMKNTITEKKNTPKGIDSRLNDTEEQISEYKVVEINSWEQKKRSEDSLRDIWDIKHINIHIIGVPEREEREKEHYKIFDEIVSENFTNLGKKIVIQFRKYKVPYRINPKRNTPRHIVIKNDKN